MKNKTYDNTAEKKGNVLSSQFHRVARIGSKIGEEVIYLEDDFGKIEEIKNPKESYIMSVNVLADLVEGIKDEEYYRKIKKLSEEFKKIAKSLKLEKDIILLKLKIKRKQFQEIVSLVSRCDDVGFGIADENE